MAVKIVTIEFLRDVVSQIKERFIDPLSSGKVDKNSNASLGSVDLPAHPSTKVRIASDSVLDEGEVPTVKVFHVDTVDVTNTTADLEVSGAVKASRIQSYVFGNPSTKVFVLPGTTGVSLQNDGGTILTTKFRSMSYVNGSINLSTTGTAVQQSCGPNGYTALTLQGDNGGLINKSLELVLAHESTGSIFFKALCDEHWIDLNLESVNGFNPRSELPITITFSDTDAPSGVQWINGTPPWSSLFGHRVRFHIINGVGTWETFSSEGGGGSVGDGTLVAGDFSAATAAIADHSNRPFQWLLIQPLSNGVTIRKPIWYTGGNAGVFIDAIGEIITGPTTASSEQQSQS